MLLFRLPALVDGDSGAYGPRDVEVPVTERTRPTTANRVGYVIAIVINAALLVVVNNLLAWGWISWLTDEFEEVLPLLNLSLTATILVNVVYLAYDAAWFKSISELGLLVISLAVTIRLYQVFPFDFSAYAADWALLARTVLIIAMVGVGIAMIVQVVKLVRIAIAAGASEQPSH